MNIDLSLLEHFQEVPLLSRCGMSCSVNLPFEAVQIASWQEVQQTFDVDWGAMKDNRYHDIAGVVANLNRQTFNQTWSHVVETIRPIIVDFVAAQLHDGDYDEMIRQYVRGDLLSIVVEQTYSSLRDNFPNFFRQLLTVYRAGHFPCGWFNGDYPKGRLIYF